jgi:tRNA threonylcarbamoyladenosine biosynthesis protein TsaB
VIKQRILAIETSSPRLSLAVGTENGVLKEYQGPLEWRHAESLLAGMDRVLRQVRWDVQSLNGVLISTGPGSFTGIRIGLAAARALGQGLQIPVVGVSSLETLAAESRKPGWFVCSLMNALRGDVFTGLYRCDSPRRMKRVWKEDRLALPDLMRKLKPFRKHPLLFVGDGAVIYKETLRGAGGKCWRFAAPDEQYPRASRLMEQGRAALARARASSYQNVIPLYLRSAAAVERKQASIQR